MAEEATGAEPSEEKVEPEKQPGPLDRGIGIFMLFSGILLGYAMYVEDDDIIKLLVLEGFLFILSLIGGVMTAAKPPVPKADETPAA